MDLMLHNVKLYDYVPLLINCASACKLSGLLAVGYSNGAINVYSSLESFYMIGNIPGQLTNSVEALEWIDGRLFATGLSGYVYEVSLSDWNLKSRLPVVGESVLSMISHDYNLAVGTSEGSISILRVHEAVELEYTLPKVDGRVLSLAWSESDPFLLASGGEGLLFIWNLKDKKIVHKFEFAPDHKKKTLVWDMKFSRDVLVTGDSRGYVCMWNTKSCGLLQHFHSHKADVLVIGISTDRELIYASGVDSVIKVFSRHNSKSTASHQRKRSVSGSLVDHGSSSTRNEWVSSGNFRGLERDVRAIVCVEDTVICGGLDSQLLILQKGPIRRVLSPMPQRQLVQVIDNEATMRRPVMMCIYPDYLELFLLGKTQLPEISHTQKIPKNGLSKEAMTLPNNSELPLEKNYYRLAKVYPRTNYPITNAQLSPCGQFIAYSDSFNTRVLRVVYSKQLQNDKFVGTSQKDYSVKIHRIKFFANSPGNSTHSSRTRSSSMCSTDETVLSTDSRDSDNQSDIWELNIPPAMHLQFCPSKIENSTPNDAAQESTSRTDNSPSQPLPSLFIATSSHVIQLDLHSGETMWKFLAGSSDDSFSPAYMLKCSSNGELLAVACHDGLVAIYSIHDKQRVFNCPRKKNQICSAHATAMTFSPSGKELFIVYSNKELQLISIDDHRSISNFHNFNKSIENEWKYDSHITSASFINQNIVVMNNSKHLIFFNIKKNKFHSEFYKSEFDCAPMEESKLISKYPQSTSLSSREGKKSILATSRYQYIVYAGAVNQEELIVVNFHPDKMDTLLPPPLAKKTFGT